MSVQGPVPQNSDEKLWGMLCHLAALAGFLIPFGNVVGPLIIWMIKKDQFPFVDHQGKESLNFQITVAIALVVAGILMLVGIGFILLPVVAVASLVFIIMASIAANNGQAYMYPISIRLIR
jgi:uncharacterized protein